MACYDEKKLGKVAKRSVQRSSLLRPRQAWEAKWYRELHWLLAAPISLKRERCYYQALRMCFGGWTSLQQIHSISP